MQLCAQVKLLNYRHDGRPFWNNLHVAPIARSMREGPCRLACTLAPPSCFKSIRASPGGSFAMSLLTRTLRPVSEGLSQW